MQWYVQVQNQAYGPYSDEQMQSYVSEGRVTAHSLISNAIGAGFYAATGYDIFRLWAGTGQVLASGGGAQPYQQTANYAPQPQREPQQETIQPQTPAYQAPSPSSASTYQSIPEPIGQASNPYAAPSHAPDPNAPTNIFLVMAEIRSEGAMGFLKALQSFGTAQRIGDTVWLLRSPSGVEQLRNTLSQTLNRQDRLFILDSSANKTAWFNIGADLDGRIRELWTQDDD